MIELQSIKFRNFQSFGNNTTEVQLNKLGTTYIVGENLDDGGSSGAGKTTVIGAISYCLFGRVPSGTKNDKLINRTNDRKNTLMEVILTFKSDEDTYVIRRTRGAETTVQLFKNGKDETPDSVINFAAKVRELIGFSYDLFSRIILFDGGSRAFLDLPVGEQRKLTEELFKITMLSAKANSLKSRIKDAEKQLDGHKILVQQQELAVTTHSRHLAEAQARVDRWEVERRQQVETIDVMLKRIADVDFENEEQLHAESDRLRQSIADLSAKLAPLALLSRQATVDLQKKRGELTHLTDGKCPYCLQKFDAPSKIAEITEWLERAEAETRERGEQVDLLKTQQESETQQLSALTGFIQHKDLAELKRIRQNAEALKQKVEELRGQQNPHLEALASLQSDQPPTPDKAKLDELARLIDHQQFLLKLLTDKNSFIRKSIISKTTPFLNKRIAYYTEKMNLPHIVKFQPDMSCEISQFGRELDHGQLSNGEKKRLNLALCLAFRDVLTYLHSKVNVLFTDEVDGGSLDGRNVDSLIGLLKHKAWDDELSIFIISHRPEFEGRCDRTLVVRKENGFSQLVDEVEA